MTKISEVVQFLEEFAPLKHQETYDNCGLIVGNSDTEISGILISLDTTEEIIDEAIAKKCNLVISHHPIVFKGLKKLNGSNYIEKTVIKAIKNDIAIYAIHTNLDNVKNGVNFKIAEILGLKNIKILAPKTDTLLKLSVFVPVEATGRLLDALYEAGAGNIGNYSHCSFRTTGLGTFKGNQQTNPVYGQKGILEEIEENRIEVIFPSHLKSKVIKGMVKGHPYEEISYFLSELENPNQDIGSGAIGELESEINAEDFLPFLKTKIDLKVVRHTHLCHKTIKKVAVCGGVGSFLLGNAIAAGAEVFVSSDFKYHEFFDAENKIIIADIGHFESEQYTKDLLLAIISKKFTTFASYLSDHNTNPIQYYF